MNIEKAKRMLIISDYFLATIAMEKCINILVQHAIEKGQDVFLDLLMFANEWLLIDLKMELLRVPN